jgi:hypothetical protein
MRLTKGGDVVLGADRGGAEIPDRSPAAARVAHPREQPAAAAVEDDDHPAAAPDRRPDPFGAPAAREHFGCGEGAAGTTHARPHHAVAAVHVCRDPAREQVAVDVAREAQPAGVDAAPDRQRRAEAAADAAERDRRAGQVERGGRQDQLREPACADADHGSRKEARG